MAVTGRGMTRTETLTRYAFAFHTLLTPEIEEAVGKAMLAGAPRNLGAKTPEITAAQSKVAAGIERRRETIRKLHAAGLDDRAIADALGMSRHTICADMRAIGVL